MVEICAGKNDTFYGCIAQSPSGIGMEFGRAIQLLAKIRRCVNKKPGILISCNRKL